MTSSTATVSENGKSTYCVDIEVNGHELIGDEPVDFGGANLGPAPYDFLTTALAECTAMTVRWYAEQKKWPLERVDVRVHFEKKNRQDVFTKQVTIVGDQLTPEQRAKLHDVVNKCPVHRTLTSDVTIETIA